MEKYEKFCELRRLRPQLVTRELMGSYGIDKVRAEESFLQRKSEVQQQFESFEKKYKRLRQEKGGKCCRRQRREKFYAIQPEKMERHLEYLASQYQKKKQRAKRKDQSPFTRCWCFYDFWSVLLHVLAILFFTMIPIGLAIYDEIVFGIYQNTEYHDKVQIEDLTIAPWHLPLKLPILAWWNIMLISFAISNVVVSLAELIIYYRYLQFPLDTLSPFKKSHKDVLSKNICRIVLQFAMWLYIFLIIGILCGYFSLVLIWSILGAILNPTAYLYYATTAFTFVTFVTVKIRELKAAQDRGIEYLMEVIERKLRDVMEFVLRRMLGSIEALS